jgi:hypothetical protein
VQQHGAPPPARLEEEAQPQPPAEPEEEAPPQTRFGLPWDPDWRIVTIKQVLATDFDDCLENMVLLGILLLIKHHLSSNDSSLTVRPRSTMPGSTFQSLHYGNQCTSMYDCIFMFTNMGMQGKCFAIITTSPTESSKILKYCNYSDYCTLGDNFAIMERDSQSSFLQDSPIVAAMNSITLIQRPLGLNEVPLLDPTPGKQWYFLFHGLDITAMKAMIVSTSRCGQTCNQQVNSTMQNCHCGCLYKANGAGIMLKMNVRFTFMLDNNRQSYTVTRFQSWRTSNLFLQPVNCATNVDVYLTDANAICPTVTVITEHVNTNGGWIICGWL